MSAYLAPPDSEFRALSARLGKDPLQVQGPGGNTSVKDGGVMWIKASGTELAHAEQKDIFVAVDRAAARAEAHGSAGDGSCQVAVLDPDTTLRPSIETTFHAAFDHAVVVHTHSIATLTHAISPEGCAIARDKLRGLPFVMVPYAKPGPAADQIDHVKGYGRDNCGRLAEPRTDLLRQFGVGSFRTARRSGGKACHAVSRGTVHCPGSKPGIRHGMGERGVDGATAEDMRDCKVRLLLSRPRRLSRTRGASCKRPRQCVASHPFRGRRHRASHRRVVKPASHAAMPFGRAWPNSGGMVRKSHRTRGRGRTPELGCRKVP